MDIWYLHNINTWTNICCSVQQFYKNQTQTVVTPSGSYVKSDASCFLRKKDLPICTHADTAVPCPGHLCAMGIVYVGHTVLSARRRCVYSCPTGLARVFYRSRGVLSTRGERTGHPNQWALDPLGHAGGSLQRPGRSQALSFMKADSKKNDE